MLSEGILEAVLKIEGQYPVDCESEVIDAWQTIINTGIVWTLQGSYGRQARALIDAGICSEGEHHD